MAGQTTGFTTSRTTTASDFRILGTTLTPATLVSVVVADGITIPANTTISVRRSGTVILAPTAFTGN